MKESISYSFLLNIIILFIFVCAAIITGIFSYYRAFRANTIITNAIEKYEGYNCLSAREAQQKLSTISYNVPFQVKCKESYGTPCMVDSDANYAVVSYNLDEPENNNGIYMNETSSKNENKKYSTMNSEVYSCDSNNPNDCKSTANYQYGVYTYMYADLPVVSSMIRIPLFTKTRVLHEFRNLALTESDAKKQVYDLNYIPDKWIDETDRSSSDSINKNSYVTDYGISLFDYYGHAVIGGYDYVSEYYFGPGTRTKYQVDYMLNNYQTVVSGYTFECGYTIDYSEY